MTEGQLLRNAFYIMIGSAICLEVLKMVRGSQENVRNIPQRMLNSQELKLKVEMK